MARLEICKPFNPTAVTQGFGENNACIKIGGKEITTPLLSGSCESGYESLYAKLGMKGHTGLDIALYVGRPVYHMGPPGTVNEISTELERGLGVGIVSDERWEMDEHGVHSVKLRYWHFNGIASGIAIGTKVNTGDLIGFGGMTGYASGPHLHFEMKPVEFDASGVMYNVFQNNGFFGCADPLPFFGKYAAEDVKKIMNILLALKDAYTKVVALLKKQP